MASKTKKIRLIRAKKHRPNKKNQREDLKRIQRNAEILRSLSQ